MAKLKIGVLTSTNRDARKSLNIANWFIEQAKQHTLDAEFEVLDVADLPFLNEEMVPASGKYSDESTKKWSKLISSCDGFVIVLAEYNHNYPAPIKNALDTVFNEWSRKPVALLGYGSYGAESSIMSLRPVLSYLNMMPIRETLKITKAYEAFDESGNPKPEYVKGKVEKFVDELMWWTSALAKGRE